jgi:hypothetical protein
MGRRMVGIKHSDALNAQKAHCPPFRTANGITVVKVKMAMMLRRYSFPMPKFLGPYVIQVMHPCIFSLRGGTFNSRPPVRTPKGPYP